MDRNRGQDKDAAAAGAERRDRKAAAKPDSTPAAGRRTRKPTVLGVVVAASAVGAWLLRRERPRAPEGTWRDALLSGASGDREKQGDPGAPGSSGPPRPPGPGTDEH